MAGQKRGVERVRKLRAGYVAHVKTWGFLKGKGLEHTAHVMSESETLDLQRETTLSTYEDFPVHPATQQLLGTLERAFRSSCKTI